MGYNDPRMARICERELEDYAGLDHFSVHSTAQKEGIFRLRYQAYHSDGLIRENAEGRLSDSQDNDPDSSIFGITRGGRLVSTIRLALITKDRKAAMTYSLFKKRLDPILGRGETIADVSRMAVSCDDKAIRRQVILYTLKIADVFFAATRANYGTIVARHSHWPFYRRYGFDLVEGPFNYPEALTPLSLMMIDLTKIHDRNSFFASTARPGSPNEKRRTISQVDPR